MEETTKHKPVLADEVLSLIEVKSGRRYLDGTFGGGGHSQLVLEASKPKGEVIALDRDPAVKKFADRLHRQYPKRFRFEVMSYAEMTSLDLLFDGILLDLGFSSDQLDDSTRGFSFQTDSPLDLRYNPERGQTAAQFLASAARGELERVFQDYAQDRHSRSLAEKITTRRRHQPIATTEDFIAVVGTRSPKVLAPLFQALRIRVNDELTTLNGGLAASCRCLKPGGVLAVITFHSLEDGIVKHFLRNNSFSVLTKKPIQPSEQEIATNSRSRSAKLRAGRWLG